MSEFWVTILMVNVIECQPCGFLAESPIICVYISVGLGTDSGTFYWHSDGSDAISRNAFDDE